MIKKRGPVSQRRGVAPVKRSQGVAARRKRLTVLCQSLPEVEAVPQGRAQEHLAFLVRKKTFAYYLFDHHRDGRIALWSKGAPGDQGKLVEEDPRHFFVPPYLGPRGWIGFRLDRPGLNWALVQYLVQTAYKLTAPRSLLRALG